MLRKIRNTIKQFIIDNKYALGGVLLIVIWVLPMLSSGDRLERGDFSYFAQVHEAIRQSIVVFQQFPWWNPWVAGGVPLYANPQAGVFSLTTLLSFWFSVPFALKLTIASFYFLGYWAFITLARYIGVRTPMAVLLGLIWIFNGFFVAHLPAHFTFIWLLLLPWYIYMSLTVKTLRGAGALGLGLAAMALAQVHYSFIFIMAAILVTFVVRLWRLPSSWKLITKMGVMALAVMLIVSGHRLYYTLQVIRADGGSVFDPASSLGLSFMSFLFPQSYNFTFFVRPPQGAYYGWLEQTAYPSLFVVGAFVLGLWWYGAVLWTAWKAAARRSNASLRARLTRPVSKLGLSLMMTATSFLIGVGGITMVSIYGFVKLLPLFSGVRISARWFVFTVLGMLLFIGLAAATQRQPQRLKVLQVLCVLGVIELFSLNFGYQAHVLQYNVSDPHISTKKLVFQQQIRFGESRTTPDGVKINGADRQYQYREYESTLYNIGTILANEAHVDIYKNTTPLCSYVAGCGLVLSKNAELKSWSPEEVIIERTRPGKIILNFSPSRYILVNGIRQTQYAVIDRFKQLTISDEAKQLVIDFRP